ncbi:MAG: hypothetical protein O3A51_11475 [Verrucomicrobia bacterium]|nr:hypothetical protein [Verrucomicrobiota bacterium]
MSRSPLSITGGESVYCINETQLRDATRLAHDDPETSPRIQAAIQQLESTLSRNERAALAFTIIERLRTQDR